jgi:hypothetical protein
MSPTQPNYMAWGPSNNSTLSLPTHVSLADLDLPPYNAYYPSYIPMPQHTPSALLPASQPDMNHYYQPQPLEALDTQYSQRLYLSPSVQESRSPTPPQYSPVLENEVSQPSTLLQPPAQQMPLHPPVHDAGVSRSHEQQTPLNQSHSPSADSQQTALIRLRDRYDDVTVVDGQFRNITAPPVSSASHFDLPPSALVGSHPSVRGIDEGQTTSRPTGHDSGSQRTRSSVEDHKEIIDLTGNQSSSSYTSVAQKIKWTNGNDESWKKSSRHSDPAPRQGLKMDASSKSTTKKGKKAVEIPPLPASAIKAATWKVPVSAASVSEYIASSDLTRTILVSSMISIANRSSALHALTFTKTKPNFGSIFYRIATSAGKSGKRGRFGSWDEI